MKFLKQNLILVFLLVFTIFQVSATEKSFVLGGKNGWTDYVSQTEGLDFTEGYLGYDGFQIASGSHKITEDTDLYISFEDSRVIDLTGHYQVEENHIYQTENSAVGRKAAVSRENKVMLSLMGEKESIFGKFGPTGPFSIEFWIKPAVGVSGESIFFWRSSRNTNQYSDYQTIEASFMNGKMNWKFINVFTDVNDKSYDLYLSSAASIMPEKWSHHYICYDENEGMLEYYIDDRLEDLVYTTDSGNAYGEYLTPDLGSPAKIEICREYTGSIDEFVISHEVRHYLDTDKSKGEIPYFVSQPLKTGRNGCSIISVEKIANLPEQTDLRLFVRGADNYYELADLNNTDELPWVALDEGIPESLVTGSYFQIAAFFYSNGDNDRSPVLSEVEIKYNEPEIPIAPAKVFVEAMDDGSIKISWTNNNFDGKYGYLLYYGTQSGEFIGVGADQGSSPVDCMTKTSCTLSGLKNGQIYYFAVASYLLDYPDIIGEMSKEVYERSLKK
ncbi:MAG: hypothetical protein K5839_03430 [Treponemataceae bacterium]|nr:hypothetical protein [Treponemataceae bacterium]